MEARNLGIMTKSHSVIPENTIFLYRTLAKSTSTFADMTTYYCTTIEEALRRVKRAVKVAYPGCYFGGITLRSGRRGFAIYREGKVVEHYTFIGR